MTTPTPSMRCVSRLALAAVIWVVPERADAQANYQSSPLGGRSAMMGGTGVALGDDPSVPLLNPGRLSAIQGQSFAFSAFFVRYAERRFGAPLLADEAAPRLEDDQLRRTFRTVPNTTCLFLNGLGVLEAQLPNQKIAICLSRPEEDQFQTSASIDNPPGRIAESRVFDQEWTRRTATLSYGFALSGRLSVGLTLAVSNARLRDFTTATSIETVGQEVHPSTLTRTLDAWNWEVFAIAGAAYRVTRNFQIGAAINTPGASFLSRYRGSLVTVAGAGGSTLFRDDEGSFIASTPPRLNLGIGGHWPGLRLELDAFFHAGPRTLATADLERSELEVLGADLSREATIASRQREHARPVVNIGAGAEVFTSPSLSVVGGIGTDFSPLTARSGRTLDDLLFRSRSNGVFAAFGLTSYTDAGNLMLGLRGDYRNGEFALTDVSDAGELKLVEFNEFGLMLAISGQFSFESLSRVATSVGRAVRTAAEPE